MRKILDVLTEIVRNVLVIVIISSFFELLLPDGKSRPFVRFAIGLFLLISILNPTLSYLYSNKEFKIDLWAYTEEVSTEEDLMETGAKINEQIMSQGDELIKQKLEGQISAVAILVPGIEEVDAKVDISNHGGISKLHIMVRPETIEMEDSSGKIGVFNHQLNKYSSEEKEAIQKKLLSVLGNMYGIDGGQIKIEFVGG
ncbi:MAG TPA: stage III sporulation protein AF [Syntrophomonadaceae bacterium]|nr:stage III sporulation protein AF [Syntrophomonadaceae bacterium]